MGLVELLLIGVGLSMDAFAVSVCKGLASPKLEPDRALGLALAFGIFQAGMPIIGYFLGSAFASLIEPVDHWIAFALLGSIGAKMVYDGVKGDDGEGTSDSFGAGEILALAVATSIDALAVGISFALLSVDIWQAASVIGLTTFALSLAGVFIGHAFGARFERSALIVGGLVLILIGARILLEHLGLLSL